MDGTIKVRGAGGAGGPLRPGGFAGKGARGLGSGSLPPPRSGRSLLLLLLLFTLLLLRRSVSGLSPSSPPVPGGLRSRRGAGVPPRRGAAEATRRAQRRWQLLSPRLGGGGGGSGRRQRREWLPAGPRCEPLALISSPGHAWNALLVLVVARAFPPAVFFLEGRERDLEGGLEEKHHPSLGRGRGKGKQRVWQKTTNITNLWWPWATKNAAGTWRVVPPPFPPSNRPVLQPLQIQPSLFQAPWGGSRCFSKPRQQRVGFLALGDPCAILMGSSWGSAIVQKQLKQKSLEARDAVGVFGLEDFERCLSPGWGVDLFLKVFFFFFFCWPGEKEAANWQELKLSPLDCSLWQVHCLEGSQKKGEGRRWAGKENGKRERKGECRKGGEKAGALKAQNLGGMARIRHVSPTTSSDLQQK